MMQLLLQERVVEGMYDVMATINDKSMSIVSEVTTLDCS